MSNVPTATNRGLTFFPVPSFDGPSQAFGARGKDYFQRHDMPDVPRKFEDAANKLFFSGGQLPEFDPRVDKAAAKSAVRAWLSSWDPSHEQKETTVGYAFWVWSTPEAIDAAIAEQASAAA